MTSEQNLGDLRQHAEEFAERSGFTYTVLDRQRPRHRLRLHLPVEGRGAGAADVRSWVRADRAELDVPVHDAVSAWLASAWPFTAVSYAPRTGS